MPFIDSHVLATRILAFSSRFGEFTAMDLSRMKPKGVYQLKCHRGDDLHQLTLIEI